MEQSQVPTDEEPGTPARVKVEPLDQDPAFDDAWPSVPYHHDGAPEVPLEQHVSSIATMPTKHVKATQKALVYQKGPNISTCLQPDHCKIKTKCYY